MPIKQVMTENKKLKHADPHSHSFSETPEIPSKHSVFDSIKKPPSINMEKIQCTTAQALDRMTLLQQRYRQHQETMRSDSDRSRRTSIVSNTDSQVSKRCNYSPLYLISNDKKKPPSNTLPTSKILFYFHLYSVTISRS
jgi:hypothetical protein